jgi:hypothetical protein
MLKRHTPDKFDQFLEDNFLSGRAISMTLCMKITVTIVLVLRYFTFLSYHLIFKLFSENEKSSFFFKSPTSKVIVNPVDKYLK